MNRHFSPALAGIATETRGPAAPRAASVVRDRRSARYRINVAARVFAGSIGSYAVVAALGTLLARALPIARPEAVMTAMLVTMLLFPAVTIWAFLTRSPLRACGGVVALAIAFGALAQTLPLPPA